jgi:hypothetical protein
MSYLIDKTVYGVPPDLVQTIRQGYSSYIYNKIRNNQDCIIYNMVVVTGGNYSTSQETFAYQQLQVASDLGLSYELVHHVMGIILTEYMHKFIQDSHVSINDIARLRIDGDKIRVESSSYVKRFMPDNMRMYPTNNFKSVVSRYAR